MVIVPLLVVLSANVDQVLARNAAFSAKIQSLSVQVEATSNKRGDKGKGTLVFNKPCNIAFDLKWGDEDFSIRANSLSIIEVERNARMYSEHEPTGILKLPPSDLSAGLSLAFPGVLTAKNVAACINPNSKKSYVGLEDVGGAKADHIRSVYSTEMAKITIDAWIDQQGAVRRYDIDVSQPGASFQDSLVFSGYKVNPATKPQAFAMKPPLGYVPYVFDEESVVVGGGQKLKLGKLQNKDGKPFDLAGWQKGQKALVVIAGPSCQPSDELLRNLKTVSGKLKTLAIVPNNAIAASADLTIVDGKGIAAAATRTPSTPLIILVDQKGVVAQVWMGFDKANIEQLSSEIRTISAQIK